jgi:small subunit ribosomal protein S20
VAHSLSAKKRVRQALKRRARNRARKEVIKDQVKAFNVALAGGDMSKAEQELRNVVSRLDKVAAKGTLHKKTASRKRSRLARRLNAVRSGALKPTVAVGGKAGGAKAATGAKAAAGAKARAGAGTGGAKA